LFVFVVLYHILIPQIPGQAPHATFNLTGIESTFILIFFSITASYNTLTDSQQDVGASQSSFLEDFSINDIQLEELDAPAKFELKGGPAQRNDAEDAVTLDNDNDDDEVHVLTSTVPLRAPAKPRPSLPLRLPPRTPAKREDSEPLPFVPLPTDRLGSTKKPVVKTETPKSVSARKRHAHDTGSESDEALDRPSQSRAKRAAEVTPFRLRTSAGTLEEV
jgi:hypothetical protein